MMLVEIVTTFMENLENEMKDGNFFSNERISAFQGHSFENVSKKVMIEFRKILNKTMTTFLTTVA